MNVLLTGAAGFIGAAVTRRLLDRGDTVTGIDNLNDYYDVTLKQARLATLEPHENFTFEKQDIIDREGMENLFTRLQPERVIHLAAQAGVRYSLQNPYAYIEANIAGFLNVLEGVRNHDVEHLVFASSSSVYGANTKMPFSVHDNVDHPLSLYGATKKANELMAHTYSNLYGIPATGLRFFTVYGPWGRPDMALYIFTQNILAGKPIQVFNQGNHRRDFTYIDDIVEGVVRVLDTVPVADVGWSADAPSPGTSFCPWRIYNIGSNNPVELLRFIEILEQCLGREAVREYLPMQAGDVPVTYADVEELADTVGYRPSTSIETGISRFVDWYREYHGL